MPVQSLIDLSHPLFTGMPVYPGDPTVKIEPAATIEADGFAVLSVHMGSQSGTHIDAPSHFLDSGVNITDVPLDHFFGLGCIVDVRPAGCTELTVKHFDEAEPDWRNYQIILIHTGWDTLWGTDEYFVHPWISIELAQSIVEAGVTTVAIDALSVDPTQLGADNEFPAHYVLLGAGCVIAENLTNISGIGTKEATISLLPLKIIGADGAPIRAIAVID